MVEFNIQGKQTSFYKYCLGTFGYTLVFAKRKHVRVIDWHYSPLHFLAALWRYISSHSQLLVLNGDGVVDVML